MAHPIFASPARKAPPPLGFAHFIARRILSDKDRTDRISRPIVVIAMAGIVLGMAVMIVTLGFTSGFQGEVRAKVIGAGGHLQITSLRQTDPKETPRIPIEQAFYPWLDTVQGVSHIQIYATKPGIIETDNDIQGVVVKGVGKDHDWTFLRSHLVTGGIPAIGDSTRPIDLLLSSYHADRLQIGLDDTITVYLVKGRDDIRPRKFRICGIYKTGLEQIDHNLAYLDIEHLQRFSQWGLKAEILVSDVMDGHYVDIEALALGGDRVYRYQWIGRELYGPGPHRIDLRDMEKADSDGPRITLVVSDADHTIPDTAWVQFPTVQGIGTKEMQLVRGGSGGSHTKYCGGFEVGLERYEELMAMDDLIYQEYLDLGLRSLSARDRFGEIFAWLELLDKNVIVVITLMVVVAIINMTSALLIIILERTNMIGVMKALGSTNGTIRRIFLIDAAYLLGIGILLGDLLGIWLCLLQQQFGIIRLPVETYYVEQVPVDLLWSSIALLNIGTLAVCLAAMILPSMLVARISPAKAIRFE